MYNKKIAELLISEDRFQYTENSNKKLDLINLFIALKVYFGLVWTNGSFLVEVGVCRCTYSYFTGSSCHRQYNCMADIQLKILILERSSSSMHCYLLFTNSLNVYLAAINFR